MESKQCRHKMFQNSIMPVLYYYLYSINLYPHWVLIRTVIRLSNTSQQASSNIFFKKRARFVGAGL